jgi:predicted AlkP superfamily pyrophosphatase or phosphodiesterase
MQPVLVIDAVGLTPRQIGARTPQLAALAARGASAPLGAVLPALTCSAQATFLTGSLPSAHGAVGNGWYFRELGEVWLWRQANALVSGQKVYERARELDPRFTCAKLFWWWNLGARVDWSLTPRPFYASDGNKVFAIQGRPDDYAARLEAELGSFPFAAFWGPRAGLDSSRWIAEATLCTLARERPTLTLAYLPHLDYDHQRFGPDAPRSRAALGELDLLVGRLVAGADAIGAETVVLSEYGIEAVERPIHVNRVLRAAGLFGVRRGPFGELFEPHASRAFAVADHQVAHVYAADAAARAEARAALEGLAGVARVLDGQEKRALGLDHPRAGDLVAFAERGAWFAYPWWLDDADAPDFARTVDIHRKPGYDPCELFVDPALRFPALRVARRLLQKKLGLRYRMDVVPLDAGLVRGSHGRAPDAAADGPVFLCSRPFAHCGGEPQGGVVDPTSVPERLLALLQRGGAG